MARQHAADVLWRVRVLRSSGLTGEASESVYGPYENRRTARAQATRFENRSTPMALYTATVERGEVTWSHIEGDRPLEIPEEEDA